MTNNVHEVRIKEHNLTIEDRIAAIEKDIIDLEERIIGIHDILIKMIEKNIKDKEDIKPENKSKWFNIFKKQ